MALQFSQALVLFIALGFAYVFLLPLIKKRKKRRYYNYISRLRLKEDIQPEVFGRLMRKKREEYEETRMGAGVFAINEREILIQGDAEISEHAQMFEDIRAVGALAIGNGCHLRGDLAAQGDVTVGEDTIVEGNVKAEGRISIGKGTVAKGMLEAGASIVLRENSQAGAVFANGHVKLHGNARIRGEVSSVNGLETLEGATIEGNIVSGGDVLLGRASEVFGGIRARGNVFMEAGVRIRNSVICEGELHLTEGAIIEGSVHVDKAMLSVPMVEKEKEIKQV